MLKKLSIIHISCTSELINSCQELLFYMLSNLFSDKQILGVKIENLI